MNGRQTEDSRRHDCREADMHDRRLHHLENWQKEERGRGTDWEEGERQRALSLYHLLTTTAAAASPAAEQRQHQESERSVTMISWRRERENDDGSRVAVLLTN